MKDISVVLVVVLIATGTQCQSPNRTHQIYFENNLPKALTRKVIRPNDETHNNINSFSWRLFQGAKSPSPVDNLILSPLSLQFLLALLETGASGETKRQLQFVTGYNQMTAMSQIMKGGNSRDGSTTLKTGAAIFIDASKRLNDSFIKTATGAGADMFSVDFARLPQSARHTVNTWASKATNGRINSLISPVTDISGMSVMLCSAIFFQGTWKYRFQRSEPEIFYTYLGKGNKAQFMELKQNYVLDKIDLGGKIEGNFVDIPYQGETYSMLVIVPNEGVPLDSFIRRMDEKTFENLIKRLPGIPESFIKLRIPKFKVGTHFSVVNALLKMGLVDPFTSTARFPFITNDGSIKITDIIQQAELDVNEDGTIAAAAAAAYAVPLSAVNKQEFVFTVNKPFIAVIVDKRNQVPLFISKIYQPYL